ncbi:MAG: hypothetical protein KAY95_01825, partial [Kaistella sp.]|nr:hypothetical protein [Kaistella sp.]
FFLILLNKPIFEVQSLMVEVVYRKFGVWRLMFGVHSRKFGVQNLNFGVRRFMFEGAYLEFEPVDRNSPLKYHYDLKFSS